MQIPPAGAPLGGSRRSRRVLDRFLRKNIDSTARSPPISGVGHAVSEDAGNFRASVARGVSSGFHHGGDEFMSRLGAPCVLQAADRRADLTPVRASPLVLGVWGGFVCEE